MSSILLRDDQWEKIYTFLKDHPEPMRAKKLNAGSSWKAYCGSPAGSCVDWVKVTRPNTLRYGTPSGGVGGKWGLLCQPAIG